MGFDLRAGLYYLIEEKNDKESRKVCGIISSVGGVVFVATLTLTILALI